MYEVIDVAWGVEVWNVGPGIGNEYYPTYPNVSSTEKVVDSETASGDVVDEEEQNATEAV